MIKFDTKVIQVCMPMNYSFEHAGFNRVTSDSVILKLAARGVIGYGECAPRKYVTGETSTSVKGILERMLSGGLQINIDFNDDFNSFKESIFKYLESIPYNWPNVRCLLELSLIDWLEKFYRTPCFHGEYATSRNFVPVIDGAGRCSVDIKNRYASGLIKIKSNRDVVNTCNTISTIKKESNVSVLVDANNSWSGIISINNVYKCLDAGAEWFEEPTSIKDYENLRKIRMLGAKILLDESVRTVEDLLHAKNESSIDGVNIRVAKCGGIFNSQILSEVASRINISRYYGVQVAEVGTLITSGRLLSLNDNFSLGVESGQSDIFFDKQNLWISDPCVSRESVTVSLPLNNMLNGRDPHER